MTPEQLKASVLQYAMQGKLVPQDPTDEPASELIKRIQAEKEQLIKEKKIKKEKTLPEITDEEKPFEIPESWEWVRLGDVGIWKSGATPKRSNLEYYDGTIPWLKTGELKDKVITKSEEMISKKALNQSSVTLNPPGSILIAMYGATIGRLGILGTEFFSTTNQACCACTVFSGIYNMYLFYFLMSERKNFVNKAEGGAQPNISKIKIINTFFVLPPFNEQKRIVQKIEELFKKIDEYAESYNKLEELNKQFPIKMEKSLLQYAMQGKLVSQNLSDEPASELLKQIKAEKEQLIKDKKIKKEKPLREITGEEIPFEIPESWEWVRLGDVTINRDGERIPLSKEVRENHKKVYDYYGASGVIDKVEDYLFEEKLLLIGEDGANLLTRSKPIAFFASGKYWVNNHAHVLDSIDLVILEYLRNYVNGISLSPYVTGTAQPKMNQFKMNSILVSFPPLNEQKRIVQELERITKTVNNLKI